LPSRDPTLGGLQRRYRLLSGEAGVAVVRRADWQLRRVSAHPTRVASPAGLLNQAGCRERERRYRADRTHVVG